MEHELQQRRGRLQALLPDAEMQDGEQPIEPAEENSGVMVSLCTVLKTRRVLINLHVVVDFIKSCASNWLCFMSRLVCLLLHQTQGLPSADLATS